MFKIRPVLTVLFVFLLFKLPITPVGIAQNKNVIKTLQYSVSLVPIFIASINGEEVWAIFSDTHLYKWDGNQFTDVSKPGETYDMLFAAGASELWIHLFDEQTHRFVFRRIQGENIVDFEDPDNFDLGHFWINSPNNIWVSGIVGTLLHYNGEKWEKYPGITNNHITNIFLNKNYEGYTTIEDAAKNGTKYKITLDSNKNATFKKIEENYSIIGIFDYKYWAIDNDSLYFISNDKQEKIFPLKTIQANIIPFEKNTIFNNKGFSKWYCYNTDGKLKSIILFTKQFALELGENGKIDSLSIERINVNYTSQFSVGAKKNIGDFSAGCGFFDKDSTLDIYSIIPTGINMLSISRGEGFGYWEQTQPFGLVEDQTTSDEKVFYDYGVLLADFDNDLDQDVIITAHQGSNLFFENNANRFFEIRTKTSGLFDEAYRNNMAIAGDVDNDGDLDLFITREYSSNVLYLNNGFGKFSDATKEVNLISERGGMGCGFADIDSDGDLDLFVANWRARNRLYRNEGVNPKTGLPFFKEITDLAGIADDRTKRSNAVGFGDVDNDGDLDLLVINRTSANRLYLNDGQGFFTDNTQKSGLVEKNDIHNSAVFLDANHDGNPDIVISGKHKSYLYINTGKATFKLSDRSGFIPQIGGNSVITGDFDNDGDIDLYSASDDHPSYLYENRQNDRRFIKLQLVGFKSNRDAVGAKIYFYKSGNIGKGNFLLGFRTVEAGSGLASTNSKIIHFGCGDHEFVDIRIKFPSGIIVDKTDVNSGSFLRIEELQGRDKFISLLKWRLATVYHSFEFWLELLVFSLTAFLMFILLPRYFKIKIKPVLHYLIFPILLIITIRLFLNNDSLPYRLAISNIIGIFTYLLIIQKYRQKLKRHEIDELTDRLWNELILFQHGEWARSNLNQLLFFSQNIDKSNQAKKPLRSRLLKSINDFIQTTYPAIRRIINFVINVDEIKKEGGKLEKTSIKIYRRLETCKNSIQLDEPLFINDMTELSQEIQVFKQEIDYLKKYVEKKYQSDLGKTISPLLERYADHNKIEITCQENSLNNVTVRIKPNELAAILDNLILNAIMATEEVAQPQLKLFGRHKNERFLIHFCDNGIGISEDKLEKIFESGYSTSNAPDKGKGLAFSREILKKYGGDIYVNSSEPGKGTEMVVELVKIDN